MRPALPITTLAWLKPGLLLRNTVPVSPVLLLMVLPEMVRTHRVIAPDLPGLHTQGDDLDDAMANANEVPPAVPTFSDGSPRRFSSSRNSKKCLIIATKLRENGAKIILKVD